MPSLQSFLIYFVGWIQREPEFTRALLGEAITVFLNGEPDVAWLVLRDLVNVTMVSDRP